MHYSVVYGLVVRSSRSSLDPNKTRRLWRLFHVPSVSFERAQGVFDVSREPRDPRLVQRRAAVVVVVAAAIAMTTMKRKRKRFGAF